MGQLKIGIWAAAALLPLAASAQVALKGLDRDMAGPRAQVLVLGTVHLSELPARVEATALDPLLARLAAFKPEIVTIEAVSGEECDLVARHPAKYGPDFCSSTQAARAATALDVPAAMAEVDKTLKAWPAQPTPAQRRHLAALFLAANDRTSAYVQWLQLPPAERQPGDGLDAAALSALAKAATRNDEGTQIAAVLAAQLGLQRVHAVDNHTGDNIDVTDGKTFGQQLSTAWATGRETLDGYEKRLQPLKTASDLLPLYRFVNDPGYLRVLTDMNVRAALRAKSPEGYPQMWVAGWEIRNLRMVANIYETFRERHGARVLSIVGASHKPWFDHWLGQLQAVDVVDAEKVLK